MIKVYFLTSILEEYFKKRIATETLDQFKFQRIIAVDVAKDRVVIDTEDLRQ